MSRKDEPVSDVRDLQNIIWDEILPETYRDFFISVLSAGGVVYMIVAEDFVDIAGGINPIREQVEADLDLFKRKLKGTKGGIIYVYRPRSIDDKHVDTEVNAVSVTYDTFDLVRDCLLSLILGGSDD